MRIRSIKPEFWRSDDIVKLRRDVRLLFVGLWSYVDDNGVGVDDFRQIAADLFALEDDPVAARTFVREGLATLSAASLVVRYEHLGRRYLFIPTWDRHQRVDKPSKPRYPRPDDCGATVTSGNADPRDILATSSRESPDGLAPGAGEQGSRGAGDTDSSSPSARTAVRDDGRDGEADPEPQTRAAPDQPGEQTAAPRGPSRSTAGTRLPDDFPLTAEMIAWARENAPTCATPDHEAFCDYWRSVPGAKGRKLDWIATWRNWMRREHNDRARRNGNGRQKGDGKPTTTSPRNRWMERE
ncbi:hypothetical protein ACFXJ8_26225 [Nonomuraea sp. NPDC059194]|uniref:hypothetical protein n=1 Tax=Nonomuraea sp. NPDC059194 TaxID=3346764 RepID=UPI00368EE813